jgi:glycosyltransferase involved in cell wall biosynthesis
VDNNSSDNTYSLLKKLKDEYGPEMHVFKETVKGANYARNCGLKHAKGEWVQFLDADDVLLPDKIQKQVDLIRKSDGDIVVGNYYREEKNLKKEMHAITDSWIGLIKGKLGITSSNLWKKQRLLDVEMWDEVKSSQEYHLLFKLIKKQATVLFDKELNTLVKNQNTASISNSNLKDNWIRFIELRVSILNYLTEKNQLTPERLRELQIIIFDSIRILYSYDALEGMKRYKKYVKGKFVPKKSGATSFLYRFVYLILGFFIAQKLSGIKNQNNNQIVN